MFNGTLRFMLKTYIITAILFGVTSQLGDNLSVFENHWTTMFQTLLTVSIGLVIVKKPFECRVWSNRKLIGTLLFVMLNALAAVNLLIDIYKSISQSK